MTWLGITTQGGGGGHTQLDHSSEAHIASDDDVLVPVRIDEDATELEHLGVSSMLRLSLASLSGCMLRGLAGSPSICPLFSSSCAMGSSV